MGAPRLNEKRVPAGITDESAPRQPGRSLIQGDDDPRVNHSSNIPLQHEQAGVTKLTGITESTYTMEDMERYRVFLGRLEGPMKPGLVLERTFKNEYEPYWQTLIETAKRNPSPIDWYITHIEEVAKRVVHRAATVVAIRRGLKLAEFLADILGKSGGEPVSAREFAAELATRRAELLTFPEAALILAEERTPTSDSTWANDYGTATQMLDIGAEEHQFETQYVDDVYHVTRGAFDDWRGVRTADKLNLAVFPDFAVEHIEHLKKGLQVRRESFKLLVEDIRADLWKAEEALVREDANLRRELKFVQRVFERLTRQGSSLSYNGDHLWRLQRVEYSHKEAFEHFGSWPREAWRQPEKADEFDEDLVDAAVDHVVQLLTAVLEHDNEVETDLTS